MRDVFDGLQEIFPGGMLEAVAKEVFVESGEHGVFANYFFKREKDGAGLAVGYAAIRVVTDEIPGKPSDRVGVRHRDVFDAQELRFTGGGERKINDRSVFSVERSHGFGFHVAVDALVEPGVFEFVGGDHAVPILMAEFVIDDILGRENTRWHIPSGAGSDE